MDITVPKERRPQVWADNQKKVKRQEYQQRNEINFKDYCELSLLFIEANDDVFVDSRSKYKSQVQLLKNPPKIIYNLQRQYPDNNSRAEEAKKEDMVAERIVKALSYAWKNITQLITNKRKSSEQDPLGIYNDENINLQFARLEKMLQELKSNKFRCSIYVKENAYIREMMEKEIEEEVVFIKLLQNILITQTKRIQEQRKNYRERPVQAQDDPKVEEQEEKLPDIRQVVKVSEYFEQKLAKLKEVGNTTKDPIDRQHENRRFNAAAIRYHMHNTNVRR